MTGYDTLRWAGIIMLAAGVIFWTGAFTPPYKQWTTNDPKIYLSIIDSHRINWYIIHALFLIAIILSIFGIQLFSVSLQSIGANVIFSNIGHIAFFLGAMLWILNLAFRVTVTVWEANEMTNTGQIHGWFTTLKDWSNFLFALFMVLSYFATGCLGIALFQLHILPVWLSWFGIIFGFAGAVLYLFRVPLFEPPLMVYLPLILNGLMILIKIKGS